MKGPAGAVANEGVIGQSRGESGDVFFRRHFVQPPKNARRLRFRKPFDAIALAANRDQNDLSLRRFKRHRRRRRFGERLFDDCAAESGAKRVPISPSFVEGVAKIDGRGVKRAENLFGNGQIDRANV